MEFSSSFGVCLLFIFYVVWILHEKWCALKLLQLTALIMLSDFLFSEISIIQCALLKIQSSFPSFQLQVITFFSCFLSLNNFGVLFIQNTEHAVHFLYSHFFFVYFLHFLSHFIMFSSYRCTIRENLRANYQLPSGINMLKVPKSLKRYIDLMD